MDKIEALIQRLDRDPDSDAIRREAAQVILDELEHSRESLRSWEKMHFEMAIALLPTVWLRLCLTHLRMAMESPSDDVRKQVEREHSQQFEAVTIEELIERVKRLGL